MFTFEVGQEVEILAIKQVGEIIQSEMTQVYANGGILTNERYFVRYSKLRSNWYKLDELRGMMEDMKYINPKAQVVIDKLLMDAFIDNGNFEAAKEHGIESGLIKDVL
ncbi:hypothetical protein ABEY43_06100 [Priestia megaterium]